MYRFIRNGKAGYIDIDGEIIIEPKLNSFNNKGREFHDGLLLTNTFDGFINTLGKVAFHNPYYMSDDFSEGLALVNEKRSGKWGYINTAGDSVITPKFELASSFSGGLAAIYVNHRWGYIDRMGTIVIPPQFFLADEFHDGMARVVTEGPCTHLDEGPCALSEVLPDHARHSDQVPPCKYGFIDRSGNLITATGYDSAKEFSEGLAPVRVGNKWGYIDKTGQTVIEPRFDLAKPFSEGLAVVQQDGLFGYINRIGAFAIPLQFETADDFSDGLAVVGYCRVAFKEGKGHIDRAYWYVDTQGKQAIAEQFDLASTFFKGLAHVRLRSDKKDEIVQSYQRGSFAYIKTTGERIFTY